MCTGRWGQQCPLGLMDGETNQLGSGRLCGWCGATGAEEASKTPTEAGGEGGGEGGLNVGYLGLPPKEHCGLEMVMFRFYKDHLRVPEGTEAPDVMWVELSPAWPSESLGLERLPARGGDAACWTGRTTEPYWQLWPQWTGFCPVYRWFDYAFSSVCTWPKKQESTWMFTGPFFISHPDEGHRIFDLHDQFLVGKLSWVCRFLLRMFLQGCCSKRLLG